MERRDSVGIYNYKFHQSRPSLVQESASFNGEYSLCERREVSMGEKKSEGRERSGSWY